MVFIDADKANYCSYFDIVFPKLNYGGINIADNVVWSGKVLEKNLSQKDTETMELKKFNKKVKAAENVDTLMIPIRDGLMICRKN